MTDGMQKQHQLRKCEKDLGVLLGSEFSVSQQQCGMDGRGRS